MTGSSIFYIEFSPTSFGTRILFAIFRRPGSIFY